MAPAGRKQLTEANKGYMIGLHESGKSQRVIREEMRKKGVIISTGGVHKVIASYRERATLSRKAGSGRPRKLTERDVHALKMKVLKNRRSTFVELAADFQTASGSEVSRHTIRRRLREIGFRSHRCTRVPLLTTTHKRKRIEWAKANQSTDWSKILWSDECRFCLSSDRPQTCIRRSGEQYNAQCIQTTTKGRLGIMVWGCFSDAGVGKLIKIIQGVKVNADIYTNILQQGLVPTLKDLGSDQYTFQQDNAPCHISRMTKTWVQENNIQLMDQWPTQSPDLNPIENLWDHIDREIHKNPINNLDALWVAIQTAWNEIPSSLIDNLVMSMPRRLEQVLKNKGGNIPY